MKLKNPLTYLWSILFPKHREKKEKIVKFLNWIKNFVESEDAQFIVNITTFTKADDKLLQLLKQWLPFILADLELAHETTNTNMALRQSINSLRIYKPLKRAQKWQELAGRLYAKAVQLPDSQLEFAKMEMKSFYDANKNLA